MATPRLIPKQLYQKAVQYGYIGTEDNFYTALGVIGSSNGGHYIRLSETFYAPSYISYLGFAPKNSLESNDVWTITKRVGSADGTIVSNVQYVNKKWTERGLL